MNVRTLFEDEVRRRGFDFSIDADSGRHAIMIGDGRILVSLENLQRDVLADGDAGRVSTFVDVVVRSSGSFEESFPADGFYWTLEPSDHHEPAHYRVAVSERVDRVLVHLSEDKRQITWVSPSMLDAAGLSEADASERAFVNLARAMSAAVVEFNEIDGVRLGYVGTALPFKASLILSPNLREVVGDLLGWPLLAVVPDRDFVYLWAAQKKEFAGRLGSVVVREYTKASYPISTEVYEINDLEIRAIGEFPTEA